MGGFIDEFIVANRSEAEAGQLHSLRGKPLVVPTALGNDQGWMTDQNQSAALSTNNVHRVVPGQTHDSLVDNPKHAAAITSARQDRCGSRSAPVSVYLRLPV
jgi:hypothetical protein